MFNKPGITKTTAVTPNQIDAFPHYTVAVGAVIDDGYYVTRGDKKIVPAGTPLYGDLTARTTAFVKATTSSTVIGKTAAISATQYDVSVDKSNAVGILLHDVDVTGGDTNGTVMIGGYVNLDRLDATTAALITDEVIAALKGDITFIK